MSPKCARIAGLLLIVAHYSHTFVLLTAKLGDVQNVARKLFPEVYVQDIVNFISKVAGSGRGDVSAVEDNEVTSEAQATMLDNEMDNKAPALNQELQGLNTENFQKVQWKDMRTSLINKGKETAGNEAVLKPVLPMELPTPNDYKNQQDARYEEPPPIAPEVQEAELRAYQSYTAQNNIQIPLHLFQLDEQTEHPHRKERAHDKKYDTVTPTTEEVVYFANPETAQYDFVQKNNANQKEYEKVTTTNDKLVYFTKPKTAQYDFVQKNNANEKEYKKGTPTNEVLVYFIKPKTAQYDFVQKNNAIGKEYEKVTSINEGLVYFTNPKTAEYGFTQKNNAKEKEYENITPINEELMDFSEPKTSQYAFAQKNNANEKKQEDTNYYNIETNDRQEQLMHNNTEHIELFLRQHQTQSTPEELEVTNLTTETPELRPTTTSKAPHRDTDLYIITSTVSANNEEFPPTQKTKGYGNVIMRAKGILDVNPDEYTLTTEVAREEFDQYDFGKQFATTSSKIMTPSNSPIGEVNI